MSVHKVLPHQPRWAPYPGFTLLFENPALTRFGSWLHLTTPPEQRPTLYQCLERFVTELSDALYLQHDGFCPLPAATYHVTAWDGPNIESVASAEPDQRITFARALAGVADSLCRPDQRFLDLIRASDLMQHQAEALTFEVGPLLLYGETALAVLVQPTIASRPAYQRLLERRSVLSQEFRRCFGIAPRDQLIPHVTLGYFCDPRAARRLRPVLAAWQHRLNHETRQSPLTFERIGLYGFHDMATFFRREQDCSPLSSAASIQTAAATVA